MKQVKKPKYEKIASSVGATSRFYLYAKQRDFIQKISNEKDLAPSEVLRRIINSYEKIVFLIGGDSQK